MDLKQLSKKFYKNARLMASVAVVGALLGIVAFIIPPKFYSTGSFYVGRQINDNATYFTYEGYYAQQTALSHTNTLAALLETDNILALALKQTGINVDENSLRRYGRYIKVSKSGPQLITLTVKGADRSQSELLFRSLADQLSIAHTELVTQSDPNLIITTISEGPITKQGYRNLPLNIILGTITGLLVGLFVIGIKEYE